MANNYWKLIHWSPLPDATYLPNYRTEYKRLLEAEKSSASGLNKYLSKVTDLGSQVSTDTDPDARATTVLCPRCRHAFRQSNSMATSRTQHRSPSSVGIRVCHHLKTTKSYGVGHITFSAVLTSPVAATALAGAGDAQVPAAGEHVAKRAAEPAGSSRSHLRGGARPPLHLLLARLAGAAPKP
eukprot:9320933-Pyramimonas_sp.AAC.1